MWNTRGESFNKIIVALSFLFATLLFGGCGTLSDGEYTAAVDLAGGSGRASVESPCRVTVENGEAVADIVWSSSNYDYMVVDGETYHPLNTEGNSVFRIPVVFDQPMQVQADTTAMSTPHLIDYELTFTLWKGEEKKEDASYAMPQEKAELSPPTLSGLAYISTDQNDHAECFVIHRYERGFSVLSVDDGRTYLIVPAGEEIPQELPDDMTVIRHPPQKIYLAASAVMCQFDSLGAVDSVALSGLEKEDWFIGSAADAMDAGTLSYGGKYNAPDYERMIKEGVDLAIENTMILHSPKVIEKLEEIKIPVLIDRSSYEEKPLGRMEWIRVYGLLTDSEDEAEKIFKEQEGLAGSVSKKETGEKTVVVFSVNSNHQIVTRRKNDYMVHMIEEAGGTYLSPAYDEEETKSQVTVSVEAFYDYAKQADILIYNGTIEDAPETVEELLDMEAVLADFEAVKSGNVWYTDKSLYQYTSRTGDIMKELSEVIGEGKEDTSFFHKLR